MSIIIPANSAAGGANLGYQVANSCRFNSASSDSLFRTTESATNIDKYTFSVWLKRSNLGASNCKIWAIRGSSANEQGQLEFNGDLLNWQATGGSGGNTTYQLKTNAKFRDPSAWYNIVVAYDSTQGTADNRLKMYINGVEETSFSSRTNPSSGFDPIVQQNGYTLRLGQTVPDGGGQHFDGYFAETVFVDGQQLTATSFGEFNSDSGIWVPKEDLADDLTFGNNGFYLEYKDSSALGADTSGNSNNFSVKNLAAIDQTTDTCTNNFITLNPLIGYTSNTDNQVYSEGNTIIIPNSTDNYGTGSSTIGLKGGKWYWEAQIVWNGTSNNANFPRTIGFVTEDYGFNYSYLGQDSESWGVYFNDESTDIWGKSHSNSAVNITGATTMANGGTMNLALDLDNGKFYVGYNGTFFTSGDPTSGATGTGAIYTLTATDLSKYIFPAVTNATNSTYYKFNFGNPAFTGTDQADGNDRGSFEYAVPSGYLSLCSLNLSEVLS